MAEFVTVAQTDEIAPGKGKMVEVSGKKIAVFNSGGVFYAIDDACTHRGGPLSEGSISGQEVTCPLHGAVFNIATGESLAPPASQGVSHYNVQVQGTDVVVEI
jgi:3-phenylpropionate/trans-cinnamate dioxygenase ferredoxin subunit